MKRLALIATLLSACSFDSGVEDYEPGSGDIASDDDKNDSPAPTPAPDADDDPRTDPVPEPTPEPCTERTVDLLVNANFEQKSEHWNENSNWPNASLITDRAPLAAHSGTFLAWLGGYSFGKDRIAQIITIPDGLVRLTLTARLATDNPISLLDEATLDVVVKDMEQHHVATLAELESGDLGRDWDHYQFEINTPLTPGEAVLSLSVDTDLLAISIMVDTLSLEAVVCD